jgi:hypothetical protein
LGEDDAKDFARVHIAVPKTEVGPLKEQETEDLDFIKDPTEYVCQTPLFSL